MNIGNLLVAKGLLTQEHIDYAIHYQNTHGGRLGDCLISLGYLTKEQIDEVLADAPQGPSMIENTGVDPVLLLELLIKGMYTESLETGSQMSDALKLSSSIINQLLTVAKERKLVEALASASGGNARAEMRMTLTRLGREFAVDAISRGQYFGPAPVSLSDYQDRIQRQRVTNEHVTREQLNKAFEGLVMPERFVSRLGPAVNSGN
ncbi:MAG: hypothetical protein AAFZ01_11625, partial [Pseudomonadota bacterium]